MAKAHYKAEGFHSLTPHLVITGAAKAMEFYQKAFGATEIARMPAPDGTRVMHAEMKIGDSIVMLADEFPEMGAKGPKALGGSAVHLLLYMEDVDTQFPRAIAAGGKELRPIKDQFYGDRSGTLIDPFGHTWSIATHKEDVPMAEMQRRFQATLTQHGA